MFFPRVGSGQSALFTDLATATRIKVTDRLRLFLGEWLFDVSLGFPWGGILGAKNPNLPVIGQALTAYILATPNVASVKQASVNFDEPRRNLAYQYSAVLVSGETISGEGTVAPTENVEALVAELATPGAELTFPLGLGGQS